MLSATAKSVRAFARSVGEGSPCTRASLMLSRISWGPMAVSDAVAVCVLSVPEEEDCAAAADEVAEE
eukprot:10202645-Alexandrium_andersonii.AAC.1